MIPGRIKQIVRTSAIAAVIVALCILPYNSPASVTFAVTSGWVILNFIAWAVIMGAALRRKDEPANPVGFMIGLFAKMTLLGLGLAGLVYFAPYTKAQLLAMVAGLGFVMDIAVLKALGAYMAKPADLPAAVVNKDAAEKVLR